MKRLDEIEARANAATEGPWEEGERCVFTLGGAPVVSDDVVHYVHGMAGEGVCHVEDAEFISHARTDVPALVAALRAVVAVHRPVTVPGEVFGTWGEAKQCEDCEQRWPCNTLDAIRRHIGEDNQ